MFESFEPDESERLYYIETPYGDLAARVKSRIFHDGESFVLYGLLFSRKSFFGSGRHDLDADYVVVRKGGAVKKMEVRYAYSCFLFGLGMRPVEKGIYHPEFTLAGKSWHEQCKHAVVMVMARRLNEEKLSRNLSAEWKLA